MPLDVLRALTMHDDGAVRTLFRRAARDPDVRDEDVSRPLTPREQALRERALAAYHVLFATGLAPDNARPRWSRRLLEELVHHCVRASTRYATEAEAAATARARPFEPSLASGPSPPPETSEPASGPNPESGSGSGSSSNSSSEAGANQDTKYTTGSATAPSCPPPPPCPPPPQANAEPFLEPLLPAPSPAVLAPQMRRGFEAFMTRGRGGLDDTERQLTEIEARGLADWINRTLLLSHADAEFQASLLPAMRALLDDAPRTALAGIAAASVSNSFDQQRQQQQQQQQIEQEREREKRQTAGPSAGPSAEDRTLAAQLRLWRDARVADALARMVLAYAIPRGGVATFLGAPTELVTSLPNEPLTAEQQQRLGATGLDRDLITTIERHARASFADHARAVTWTERWAMRLGARSL
jgi:hypothetical protein